MSTETQIRTYKRAESAVFSKTKEGFGGLSNMAAGFPLQVNGAYIRTSEALYQACRFPHLPDVQRLIIGEASPMTAKMKSKPYRKDSRPDWDRVRVKIMRWCLRVKLAQNWSDFSRLLLSTGDRPIVEESRKDDFWGAKIVSVDTDTLVGTNALGRLLMELREQVKHSNSDQLRRVEPLPLADFLLFGESIAVVEAQPSKLSASSVTGDPTATRAPYQPRPSTVVPGRERPMLFGTSVSQEKGKTLVEALKPYPEYKESRQAWLGLLPKHWLVLPNRALFAEVNDRDHADEEMLSVTITKGIIKQKALLTGSSKKDSSREDKSAYKLVQPRDIAYNKMRAWQGAIGASELRGIVSPAYIVMRLRDQSNLSRYFHYLYRTPQFAKDAERWSYGITSDMWSLRPEHFKMIYTPQAPPGEQAAIVRFLDWANGRLERAVRAKRKGIALLNEQKQAIIQRAVTRGLDTSVPLKPSRIPWLGDIPRHWETPLFGRLLTGVEQGWSPVAAEGELALNQWAVLTLSAVRRGVFNPAAIKPVSLTADIPMEIELGDGDVLLTRSNTRDRVGDVCIVRTPRPRTILCVLIYRLRLRAGAIAPEFLVYQLLSHVGRGQIERDARGSSGTMPKISQGHIKSWRILLPPSEEQQCIVKSIDAATAPVDSAISRLEREIDLLREYRTRLVADVVTGKLDVREAATRLPEEAAPDTPEDDTDPIIDSETADEEAVV